MTQNESKAELSTQEEMKEIKHGKKKEEEGEETRKRESGGGRRP